MPHCPPELNQASPFLDRPPHTDELYTPPGVGTLQSSDHGPGSLPQEPACQATPQKLLPSPAQHTAHNHAFDAVDYCTHHTPSETDEHAGETDHRPGSVPAGDDEMNFSA